MQNFSSTEKHQNLLQEYMDPISVMDLVVRHSSAPVAPESSKLLAMEDDYDEELEFLREENQKLQDKLDRCVMELSRSSKHSSCYHSDDSSDLEFLLEENEILHGKLERCVAAMLRTSSFS
ncbi:unnamed protein product [Cylindrotheca closterium]|uniref:Uncharacterized protein n=1 Tax=Cylindrotheca closterium TaxID=2856 RepID=A0AAD2FBN1_9STRA|nr:unnamed protein product [Cylindrotheca closterium]